MVPGKPATQSSGSPSTAEVDVPAAFKSMGRNDNLPLEASAAVESYALWLFKVKDQGVDAGGGSNLS